MEEGVGESEKEFEDKESALEGGVDFLPYSSGAVARLEVQVAGHISNGQDHYDLQSGDDRVDHIHPLGALYSRVVEVVAHSIHVRTVQDRQRQEQKRYK